MGDQKYDQEKINDIASITVRCRCFRTDILCTNNSLLERSIYNIQKNATAVFYVPYKQLLTTVLQEFKPEKS